MTPEQPIISYDQFMPQPLERRRKIFNEVSAENRALLIKTHVERWLAAHRTKLTSGQVAILEEIGGRISPEWYQEGRDSEKVRREVEGLQQRVEAVLPFEDVAQILGDRADYVPAVEAQE